MLTCIAIARHEAVSGFRGTGSCRASLSSAATWCASPNARIRQGGTHVRRTLALHRMLVTILLAWTAFLSCMAYAAGPPADAHLAAGSGSFAFPFLTAGGTRTITVWYHRPERAANDAPIVFVMHGEGRTAQNYRRHWIPQAEARRFILLVPEFSHSEFPGPASYNEGHVTDASGRRRPEAQWSYTAIEDIFDAVRKANALSASTYDLYGHSAGGQFVHRLVMLKPHARYRVAVSANPGRYMMPDYSIPYPHGLGGAGIDEQQLAHVLGRRLIVLLGDQDNDPNHPQLSRAPAAMAQGEHRFARGHAFYDRAQHTAASMKVPLGWSLQVAPGVAHSNLRMTPHAALALAATR